MKDSAVFIEAMISQLQEITTSLLTIIDQLHDHHFSLSLGHEKRNVHDLLAHLSVIGQADILIMNEASEAEMNHFYATHDPQTRTEIKQQLLLSLQVVTHEARSTPWSLWEVRSRSWWGHTRSKIEWMQQLIAHVYHHQGQLHALLTVHDVPINCVLFP
ncbi:hypothetical protein A374_05721 [Fictibacillus macauensis ZFHKF-1]|uniref:DinB family protein n=1 Tax=Fictibacillus macauensis ZFHKF-1 TaxID=1196324 RepID=I8J3U3_9BACL|nr:hypothetical protein [Fictibacillus macauensis]EIT86436.1 hypothetical protein A374_05721 [Fictibacillus macauensis ZFHKF-1]